MNSLPLSAEKPLAERLRERIRREGAITFRDWMAAALYDERGGYYCRPDLKRWGREGDYRTSPERSPLFATTFALYFAKLYGELGAPREWTIFEGGAGAGHFARGVLATLRRDYPKIFSATRYLIDEVSADARPLLNEFAEKVEFRRFSEISAPAGCGIVFANELLDAFPVHRVEKREGRLLELFVELNEAGEFVFAVHELSTPELTFYFERLRFELSEGHVAEVNLEVEGWLRSAAALFERGYLVIVDYGAEACELYNARERRDGTLRSFHRHGFAGDVLARPGEQDLTTTIDWTNVRRVAEESGLQTLSLERQDKFLLRAGLLQQLERESAEAKSETEALILRSSVRDLILPGGMSESFQVLVMKSNDER
ncbi:MAG: SAM-dependent methyltransferase [Acidobacteriota bacterium]|nr:SAM-dependent methyltransferase [Acidobacteriota bacterium]